MTKRDYDKRVIETKGSVLVCRWEGCFIDLEYDACHYNATDWLLIRETVTVCVRRVSLPARAQRQLTDMTWLRHMPNYWHISRWWHGRNIFPQWQYGVHKLASLFRLMSSDIKLHYQHMKTLFTVNAATYLFTG